MLAAPKGGNSATSLVTATIADASGKYVTLTFAGSLTGAGVTAYVKGGTAYNRYQITVGTSSSDLLHAPLNSKGKVPVISHYLVCQTSSPPPSPSPSVSVSPSASPSPSPSASPSPSSSPSISPTPSPSSPGDSPPVIYLGYADDTHTGGTSTPTPWQGDPGIVYIGCTDNAADCGGLDAGAIRIDNPAGNVGSLNLTAASVDIGPCHFTPWTALLGSGQTAAPGHSFVLTQTGLQGPPMPDPCNLAVDPAYWSFLNFDTSERPGDNYGYPDPTFRKYDCDASTGVSPVIQLEFNGGVGSGGTTLTITDTNKVLNTGGVDAQACFGTNEGTPWTGPIAYTP